MRVHPDQAQLLAAGVQGARRTGHRAGGEGVIAAENDREPALTHGFLGARGQVGTHPGDGRQKIEAARVRRERAAVRHGKVAVIEHVVAEGKQRTLQARRSHGIRSHVNATAACAEVEGNANEINLGHEAGSGVNELRLPAHRMTSGRRCV